MKLRVAGIGAWGPGFSDWAACRVLLDGGRLPADAATARPAPACIPPRERRRAPLSVKLAVAVAEQACTEAGVAPAETVSVFASGMGDMDITDYMCRTLASDQPLVSPTKFHNSVHNAPVGYWTISQGATMSSNAVAGFRHTVPASLLEAATQCLAEDVPVLWACQDIASPAPFRDIADIPEACAFALLLQPGGDADLSLSVAPGRGAWPEPPGGDLAALYASNPTARLLPVLDVLRGATNAVALPLGDHLDLTVRRS